MSDSALERLCSLSLLAFESEQARERARSDVSAVLSAAQVLQEALSARAAAGLPQPRSRDARLAELTEAQLEAAAEASWALLRKDEAEVEGCCSAQQLLAQARKAEAGFFVTPKVVAEE